MSRESALQEEMSHQEAPEEVEHGARPLSEGGLPTRCDGKGLRRLVEAALAWLENQAVSINALNVFPVPDGDTGTNMLLTLRSACKEVVESSADGAGAVAHALAYGALMGARGNSGVILSQLLRGFARRLEGLDSFGVGQFAEALREASITAYKGVIKPVEGTILTVSRDIAQAAEAAARETQDLRAAMERVVHGAWKSVNETPHLLPVLAEAGVVDAGGQGLAVIMEGMLRYLEGESTATHEEAVPTDRIQRASVATDERHGYDIQFILQGHALDFSRIRQDISVMGESVLVVGDESTIKVHLHSPDPGRPLSYASQLGALSDVVVENLQTQCQEFVKQRALATAPPEASPVAIVAVARGEGIIQVFESLGASAIVPGGQTMNPSTEELLQAIESLPGNEVIVLPNNPNVIPTAQQAQSLSAKAVRVIPTCTIPEGVAALLAFNYQADLEANVQIMLEGAKQVQTGEVTTAVRDVQINGIRVRAGQTIGLWNGELVTANESTDEVVRDLLSRMGASQAEIITVYYGADVSEEEAQRAAERIHQWFSKPEVELVSGGQPHYPYILSAE